MDPAQLAKLKQNVRTGGKGTPRRKKKVAGARTSGDDKKLVLALKKLQVTEINGIGECNFFKSDNTIMNFQKPSVQGSLPSRTFCVSGKHEVKSIEEMMPDILHQLGPESYNELQKMAARYQQDQQAAAAKAAGANAAAEDDDDDVPELVENFDS